jgi:enamine deaminase RidA (YjgF/YER057c/UK114 family)
MSGGIKRIGTTRQRWSDVVIHNGTLYVVEVPITEEADIHHQTQEVLGSLKDLLESNGSGVDKILMVNIFLKDIKDIDAFNEQWDKWIPAGTAPVRACVQACLAHPSYKVEVQLTAAGL